MTNDDKNEYPFFCNPVKITPGGVYYFTEPSVVMIGRTRTNLTTIQPFLDSFDSQLGFSDYLKDDPGQLTDGTALCKFAGQLCYAAFGPKRTYNKDAQKYFTNVIQQGHGCYDAETEVLTEQGWKKWAHVTYNDLLATRTADGFLEYHSPIRLISYDYEGRMYSVNSDCVNLLVTPNHNMLAAKATTKKGRIVKNFSLIKAEDLGISPFFCTKIAEWKSTLQPISPIILKLLGFAIGDAHFSPACNQLKFHLKRKRKIEWLQNVVKQIGWRMYVNAKNDNYCVDVPLEHRPLFRSIYDENREKHIPPGILSFDKESLLSLFEGLIEADGHRSRTALCFDSTSQKLIDQVQQLCLHIGMAANISYSYLSTQREKSYGKKTLTRLHVIKRALQPLINKYSKAVGKSYWIDDWKGKVYCAEVPNHTLYVRRKGTPVWSGNSVVEHSHYSFLLYGIDRAITKELCRHRLFNFSEISQRYVNGSTLRFVERASFQNDPILHKAFIDRIEKAHFDYSAIADRLAALQSNGASEVLSADSARDLRKKVNESARACLPNETESPMVMTGNIRSWRHVIEMRASDHAEFEIRRVAVLIYRCLKQVEPVLFGDYEEIPHKDGIPVISTKYRKV